MRATGSAPTADGAARPGPALGPGPGDSGRLLVALVVAIVGAAVFVTSLRSALEKGLVTSAKQEVASVQAQLRGGERPEQAVVSGQRTT